MSARVPSKATRAIVNLRDGWHCQRCSRQVGFVGGVVWRPYSLQHRTARGMGGTVRPWVNLPANLITLCGTATTPGGCHLWAESRPPEAYAEGWVLRPGQRPETVPVKTFLGWALLDNDGNVTYVDPPTGPEEAPF